MHYHMISGLHGYMPDQSEPYETEADAKNGLDEFVRTVWDSCEEILDDAHPCNCTAAWYEQGTFVDFLPGHGVEYAEVAHCAEAECESELVAS